jgi:hypothetical protein
MRCIHNRYGPELLADSQRRVTLSIPQADGSFLFGYAFPLNPETGEYPLQAVLHDTADDTFDTYDELGDALNDAIDNPSAIVILQSPFFTFPDALRGVDLIVFFH